LAFNLNKSMVNAKRILPVLKEKRFNLVNYILDVELMDKKFNNLLKNIIEEV
jgi:hypothetical protein